jgi:SAM-dependent methyltransferase
VGDARTLSALKLPDFDNFDRIVCLLAIQNMDPLDEIFRECALRLKPQGRLVLMMMHPCFRIPRQSHWGYDAEKGSQYRRIERYQSELKIPILTHPGKDQSLYTWSFHRPLSLYFKALAQAHFVVEDLEEFISSKTSEPGPRARAENRAREEIPLFLGLRARKESAWLS